MHFKKEDEVATKWLKEAQKGYTRLALLILLSKKPYHGYEMMKEVEDRTEGFWKPTAGGVYPILQSLEKSGYIVGKWNNEKRKRKMYQITESGKFILDRALLKNDQIIENLSALFKEYSTHVLDLEVDSVGIPQMKSPLSAFLEESPSNKREALELKRNRLQHMIEMLNGELQKVDKRLGTLKKKQQKADPNSFTEEEKDKED
jgi:DNA-binding PadR family transcriptional regulator